MIKNKQFYKFFWFAHSDAEATGTPAATEPSEVVRGLTNYLFFCFGSAWLGSARLGSGRLGSARLGFARLGLTRLCSARHGLPWLGSAWLVLARLGSARLSSAWLGLASLGLAQLGSAWLVQFWRQLVLQKLYQIELFVDFELYGELFFLNVICIHINVIQILVPSNRIITLNLNVDLM